MTMADRKFHDTDVLPPLAVGDIAPIETGDMQLLVFAVAFSIMGLLPSIASTLSFSIPAGPVGMVWGGLLRADLASAMPTAGGLYFWTHYFSGEKWKNPLSFVVGYSNTIGLLGGVCSVDSRDGTWTASRPVLYGTYVACVVIHGLIATFFARIMPNIQSACIVSNVGLVVATVLALPIGKFVNGGRINSAAYVFGHLENLTYWPQGWTFIMAWLSPIWTIGAFDSCVHMSEEATHAARAVPLGIIWSAALCGVLGFVSLAVIAAVIDVNLEASLKTSFGQPMAQVIAASRQSWAFSRDGALPFSWFFRHVSKRIRFQPVRMVWGVVIAAIIVGLLSLINNAAASALFSLAVAGNDLAWMMPILCRLVWGQERFHPGEFYTGRFSRPVAVIAIIYLIFAITLSMFPTTGPNPTAQDMNYTVVINGALWGGALLYYALYARKVYRGPQTTVKTSSSPLPPEMSTAGVEENKANSVRG
ncbi:hypothetical protein EYZ11_005002 [Aspergillus tanneri]|uniref:GABA-specific high-affinity permease n=1 Tax=Aspergillus tanneri TaxID=1220188 RepID=A0A4S3JJN8_9EURO|nr:hypothetical protein EYZ11_005002 [Aspergillus tanneri]